MLKFFKDWIRAAKLIPEFQKPYFKGYVSGFGALIDDISENYRVGVKSRFPSYAHDNVLSVIGEERKLPRGTGESREAYAARLVAAWETWAFAGTAYGVLRALDAVGYTGVKIAIVNSLLYSLDGDKELVVTPLPASSFSTRPVRPHYEGSTPIGYWSEFDVILGPPWPAGFTYTPRVDATVGTRTQIQNTNGVTPPTLSVYKVIRHTSSPTVRVQVRPAFSAKSYRYSLDGGATWSGDMRMLDDASQPVRHVLRNAAGDYLGLAISGWLAAGAYVAGDEWSWPTTALVPASFSPGDTSSEANLVRWIVKTWKPSDSICHRIILYASGQCWGFPDRTWAQANAAGEVWGGSHVAYWTGVA